jgi:FkbM family methyltransferase
MTPFVAHGQNWEDVRLRRIFAGEPRGFYIDVGAAHPTLHSFSYTLYQQGWRGINVEPHHEFFSALQRERTEDVNLQAIVGRSDGGVVRFYEIVELPGSSTISYDVAEQYRHDGYTVVEHEPAATTLRSICERFAPEQIDVLKVDVESAEADVLAGGDWDRFRPRLVVIENNAAETWEPLLLEHGYLKAAFDGVNLWYVEESESAWIDALAPPVSVLDDFVPYEFAREASSEPASGDQTRTQVDTNRRPRVLLALSSANQLYSGTGRVIFETLGRLTSELRPEIAIDEQDARNVRLAREFCAAHDLPLHVGRSVTREGAPDTATIELAGLLESASWDVVVAVSWANAATNSILLENIENTALAYLPLHQPSWTVPMSESGRRFVDEVHRSMLTRADVVLCISPWERHALARITAPEPVMCAVVPPGCDFRSFQPGARERGNDLLFVGDHREPRKRFDRVVAVLGRLRRTGVDARLHVVGNQSEQAVRNVPPDLAKSIVTIGYVTEERLTRAYRDAALLLLLSDYEAFGLPIIESLASATPVVMANQPAPASLFTADDGVHFVDADDIDAVAELVGNLLAAGPALRDGLIARRSVLAERFDWNSSARKTRDHLLAAWSRAARSRGGFPSFSS